MKIFIGNKIFIRPEFNVEKKNSNFIIPEISVKLKNEAVVVYLGQGIPNKLGGYNQFEIKEGDRVIYDILKASPVQIGDEKLSVIREEDIFAVIS